MRGYINYDTPEQVILEVHLPDGRAVSVDIHLTPEFADWQAGKTDKVLLVKARVLGMSAN